MTSLKMIVGTLSVLSLMHSVNVVAEDAPVAAASDYSIDENWLCRPERDDACTINLDATIVSADGSLETAPYTGGAGDDAPIDCFYVYPTVSRDFAPNSDMVAGPEEISVVKHQLARFGSVCRVFAPMYRQVSLMGLRATFMGADIGVDQVVGYTDVHAAWTHYLENDNDGRGVVLVGHSQGTGVLTELIKREIDGKDIQGQIVSALLIGLNVEVPEGKTVGGSFQSMPICTAADETGCAIGFMSFRSDVPPPAESFFARTKTPGMVAACVNPAVLDGSDGALDAYLGAKGTGFSDAATDWTGDGTAIDTAFVKVPGLLTAECKYENNASYLEITTHGDPADARTDTITGDVMMNGTRIDSWGLHLIDLNLTMGNLLSIVDRQSTAWRAR